MRLLLLLLTLLWTVPAFATAPTLHLYHTDGIFAQEEGLESNVIVEDVSGVLTVRLWFSHATYINSSYAVGGANNGSLGFASDDIYYMDCPASEFTAAVAAGTPITWYHKGLCVANHSRSCVRKGPDGMYHMMTYYAKWLSNDGQPYHIDYYQSSTGMAGSWTLVTANAVLNPGSGWDLGNNSFRWKADGTVEILVEYQKPDWTWTGSYWTGATLSALTRQTYDIYPLSVGSGGEIEGVHSGSEIMVGHGPQNYNTPGAVLPTGLNIAKASTISTGWSLVSLFLAPSDLGYFRQSVYGTAYPYVGESQLADPTVFEIDGKTYIIYEALRLQNDIPSLSVGWWDAPLDSVVAGFLGITTTAKSTATMRASFR